MKHLPINTCPACGGSWFREVTLHMRWKRKDLFLLPVLSDASSMPMTVLVCLCGTPLRPQLGGVRGGHTPNAEINDFFRSFDKVEGRQRLREDHTAIERLVSEELTQKKNLHETARAVRRAEQKVSRRLAPRENARMKRGGHWRLPQRPQVTKAIGRDWLARELQNKGLTFDEARDSVAAIIDGMVDALKRGESVETPLGEFRVVEPPKPHLRFRFRRLQKVNRKRKKVVFKARED